MGPPIFSIKWKTLQLSFQTLIDNFSLAISLGMVVGVDMQLGSLELEKLFPKIVGEIWISVRDNRIRKTMKFEDIIHENLSHCGCCEWVLKRI